MRSRGAQRGDPETPRGDGRRRPGRVPAPPPPPISQPVRATAGGGGVKGAAGARPARCLPLAAARPVPPLGAAMSGAAGPGRAPLPCAARAAAALQLPGGAEAARPGVAVIDLRFPRGGAADVSAGPGGGEGGGARCPVP